MDYQLNLRLHHVGYVTKDIATIAAEYGNRYGYEIATPVIHDPLQTAFVQFLKLNDDRVLLEFVAPNSLESKLWHSARRGGLNHLCYSCGPLGETIEGLQERGMRLIMEPKPGVAFAGRRICWMIGDDPLPVELVERESVDDPCTPGLSTTK
jgi:methylmalonyl-CoA/ethylmalonyl-CoA epimerase